LFGNAYVEVCITCGTHYRRKVVVPGLKRLCDDPNCGGRLKKTGVRFGQLVPVEPLKRARKQSSQADLGIVLGSSMTVGGFMGLPEMAKEFVIVNLQETAYDNTAGLSIHTTCDHIMKELIQFKKMKVGSFVYQQDFNIKFKLDQVNNCWNIQLLNPHQNEVCTCVETVLFVKKSDNSRYEIQKNFHTYTFSTTIQGGLGMEVDVTITYREEYGVDKGQLSIILDTEEKSQQVHFVKSMNYD